MKNKSFIFIVLAFLASLKFLDYRDISVNFTYYLTYIAIAVIILTILKNIKKFNYILSNQMGGKFPLAFVILIITSSFSSYIYHGQNLTNTILAGTSYLTILVYYYLHIKNINPNQILKMIICIGLIKTGIQLIENYTYPTLWFGHGMYYDIGLEQFGSRNGILRLFLSLAFWLNVLGFFYYTEQYRANNKIKTMSLLMITAIGIYIDQSRTIMVSSVVVFIYTYFFSENRSKTGTSILATITIIGIGYIVYSNFSILFGELSKQTSEDLNKDYIRIYSYQFYLYDNWKGPFTVLFGNGIPSNSIYSKTLDARSCSIGLFKADIGIVGTMNTYGILFVVVFLYYFYKVFRYRRYMDKYLFGYAIFSLLYLELYCPIHYDSQSNFFFALYMYLVDQSICKHRQLKYTMKKK